MRWPTSVALVVFFLREANSLSFSQTANQHSRSRRTFVLESIFLPTSIAVIPTVACAEEAARTSSDDVEIDRGGRPYAPMQALLPATRLKLWVDGVYTLSQDITTTQDKNERFKIVQTINERLSNPPTLFQGEKMEKRVASTSTAQLSTGISPANKNQYQLNRKGLSLGDKMTAMLNQADVERQWGMLQFSESKREEGSEMRAAFNFYTRQVSFAEEYTLTASKEERKRMIRNDELPTVTAVITSDLDRRDLYRNEFLTSIDDACAEAAYQAKQKDDVDVTDLVDLVNQAHSACDNWFSLIASQDVEEAIKNVGLQLNNK